jgi:hypothetical protein
MEVLLDRLSGSVLDPLAWDCICRRLCLPVSSEESEDESRFAPRKTEEVPLGEVKSWNRCELLQGIIWNLTNECGGNVHEKGIVTLTSKSVYDDDPRGALKNLVDLMSEDAFMSKTVPGEWICWDFHELRVRPTHYTICSSDLQSWVLEGSLDGESWAVIDRRMKRREFTDWNAASFAVYDTVEVRFIRLSGPGGLHPDDNGLLLTSVEFFGTLSK